jgi:hypothetical protein
LLDFILRYWVQELFALIIAMITWMVRAIHKKKDEYDILREGILALLHDRLYQSCSFFIERGFCTYTPYKALGGNGTGESLYKKCLELPITADRNKEKEE